MPEPLFQRKDQIRGEDTKDTRLLREMADTAVAYITSFSWCPELEDLHLAFGVGGVVALFLVEFKTRIAGADGRLWIVTGDLPSAYFVVNDGDTPASALQTYCELMEDWADAVMGEKPLGDVFPVASAATKENAEALRRRISFLGSEILARGLATPDSPHA